MSKAERLWDDYRHFAHIENINDNVVGMLGLNGRSPQVSDFENAPPEVLNAIHCVLGGAKAVWSFEHGEVDAFDGWAVREELWRLRNREAARRIFDAEGAGNVPDRLGQHRIVGADIFERPEPGYVIEDVVPVGGLTVPYGPPKGGKTFVTLDQSLSVATGRPWAVSPFHMWGRGLEVIQGHVEYVIAEGQGRFGRRVRAWLDHHQADDVGDITFTTCAVNLTNPAEVEAFIDLAGPAEPVMIVFDTLARCMGGNDENGPVGMGAAVDGIDRVREATGAAVVVPHHTPLSDPSRLRGHTALHGALDASFLITRADRKITWACKDMKDGAEPTAMTFDMIDVAGSIALRAGTPPADPGGDANLAALAREAVRTVRAYQEETEQRPTVTTVIETMKAKARYQAKRAAIDYAADLGELAIEKGTRGALHVSYVGGGESAGQA